MQPLVIRFFLILLCYGYLQASSQEKITPFDKSDGLTSTQITCSLVDSKGIVWFGSLNGLNVYAGSKWIPIKAIEDNKSGSDKQIGRVELLYEDLDRNVWVSSDQGLFLYNRKYWTFFEPEGDIDYLTKDFILDRSGAVWMTLEYFQDLKEEMGFSIVSGKLQMYKNRQWFKFDEDVAGSASIKNIIESTYFTANLVDRNGNMWFATLEGVFTFDGKEWSKYKKDELDAERVFDLIEDAEGNFWAATENGISYFSDKSWKNFSKKDGLGDNLMYKLAEDKQGRIWAYGRNDVRFSGLSLYENENWKSFNGNSIKLKSEVEELVFSDEKVFAFSKDGVSVFENDHWKKLSKSTGLSDKSYSFFKKDRAKNVWVAGDHGLCKFSNGNWERVISRKEKWEVLCIFLDKKSRVWIGTNKSGLFKLIDGEWKQFADENGLPDKSVSDIFEDRFGNIWVITKKGLAKISEAELSN